MRIILLFIMFYVILISPSACSKEQNQSDIPADSQVTDTASNTSSETVDHPYDTIECRAVGNTDWSDNNFTLDGNSHYLKVPFPNDWVIVSGENSQYDIMRNGVCIGTVSTDQPTDPTKEFEADSTSYNNLESQYSVYQISSENNSAYKRVFGFTDTSINKSVYVSVDIAELDKFASSNIYYNTAICKKTDKMGCVSLNPDNPSREMLIIGNSFIGSSQITTFLKELLKKGNTGYTVTDVCIGGGNLTTYTTGEYQQLTEVRTGKYCVVFLCGLYSESDVTNLAAMKRACEDSNTKLVVLPAHNESETQIQSAISRYPDVTVLNWKNEINNLITDGVDYYDFCKDDYHKHSKYLAGYVGAHLIYCGVFGKIPPEVNIELLPMSTIREKLGDYVDTGRTSSDVLEMVYKLN